MVAVERLKLTVQVLLTVSLVRVSVKSNTVRVVGVQVLQLHSVPAQLDIWHFKFDFLVAVDIVARDLIVIDFQVSDRHTLEIEEKFTNAWLFLQEEVYDSLSKVVTAFVERKLEIILDF